MSTNPNNDNVNIRAAIRAVLEKKHLTFAESEAVMKEIMSGAATPAQIAAFLTALRLKGETVEEISACAKVMREFAHQITPQVNAPLLDTCGTGGDGLRTFNISTVTAIVCAAAGIPVAKHGNRAMSSSCGSADLLEAFGVKIDLDPHLVLESIEQTGIGFLFAPKFHPAMRFASPVRREIGIPTVFNILGPLTNPASAQTQILGVASEPLAEQLAGVLQNLGVERAYVVTGHQGMDEISISGQTIAFQVTKGSIDRLLIQPEDLGFQREKLGDIVCDSKNDSVITALKVLRNEAKPAQKNAVLLNCAYAIAVAKQVTPEDGLDEARAVIESGGALAKLKDFVIQTGGKLPMEIPV